MACAQRCFAAFLLVQLLSTSQAGFLARKHDGDDGDLAEAEVEKIQLSEQLDNDNEEKAASTEADDSEEEFDPDQEARRSEMYEDYDGADSAALIQGRAKARRNTRKHDGDDEDLADGEVEKIQLAEELDNDNTEKMASTDSGAEDKESAEPDYQDDEEEFDAEIEARRSEMYEGYGSSSAAALIQGAVDVTGLFRASLPPSKGKKGNPPQWKKEKNSVPAKPPILDKEKKANPPKWNISQDGVPAKPDKEKEANETESDPKVKGKETRDPAKKEANPPKVKGEETRDPAKVKGKKSPWLLFLSKGKKGNPPMVKGEKGKGKQGNGEEKREQRAENTKGAVKASGWALHLKMHK